LSLETGKQFRAQLQRRSEIKYYSGEQKEVVSLKINIYLIKYSLDTEIATRPFITITIMNPCHHLYMTNAHFDQHGISRTEPSLFGAVCTICTKLVHIRFGVSVCLSVHPSVSMFEFENSWTDFDEILC
jgi:hypothetical protein